MKLRPQSSFLLKYLRVGIINLLPSIAPILIYAILSKLYNNDNISMGFSLSYPYQFIFMAICSVTITAQIKGEARSGSIGQRSYSGVIIWLIIAAGISAASFIHRDKLLNLFNTNCNDSLEIFMYGIAMLTLDYTIYYTVDIWTYQENFKKSFLANGLWYISRFITTIIVPFIVKDYRTGLYTIILLQTIMLLVFLISNIRVHKFYISIREGFKYSISSLPSQILNGLTYVLGYSRVSQIPGGYFQAYNTEALCSDTQWDILSSGIETTVTTEVCKNGVKNKKQYLIDAILYSILLYASSAVMLLLYLNIFNEVDKVKTWVVFFMECTTFPVYAIIYSIEAEVVIRNPIRLIAILTLIRYVTRTMITFYVQSPYAISFGLLANLLVKVVVWVVIYRLAIIKHRCQSDL